MKFNVKFRDEAVYKVGFCNLQTVTIDNDYNLLANKPSINGHVLVGDQSGEDLGLGGGSADFPEEGNIGDILMKTSMAKDGVSWVTPASNAEQDNTRPITSAAVYTEIGNINALLATI